MAGWGVRGVFPNISFSPRASRLFLILTGQGPPGMDTSVGMGVAGAFRGAAERAAGELAPEVSAASGVVASGSGLFPAAFGEGLGRYGSVLVPGVAGQLAVVGEFVAGTCDQAQEMKVEALAALAALLASLAVDAVVAFFAPAAGAEAAAAEVAAVRAVLESLLDGLAARVAQMVVVGAGVQVVTDAVAQAVLIAEGVQRGWNWRETGEQVGVGALGGVMGAGLAPVEEGLAGALAGLARGALGAGDVAAEAAGKDAGAVLGKDAGEVVPGEVVPGEVSVPGAPAGAEVPGVAEGVPAGVAGVRGEVAAGVPGAAEEVSVPGEVPAGVRGEVAAGVPGAGSAGWLAAGVAGRLADGAGEFAARLAVGGFHNAGHAFLWSWMTTGRPVWDWGTFSGGSAQGVSHVLGVAGGSAGRVSLAGAALPAGDLVSLLGPVTPQMLNEITAAGPGPVTAAAAGVLPGGEVPAVLRAGDVPAGVPAGNVPGEVPAVVPAGEVAGVRGGDLPASVPGKCGRERAGRERAGRGGAGRGCRPGTCRACRPGTCPGWCRAGWCRGVWRRAGRVRGSARRWRCCGWGGWCRGRRRRTGWRCGRGWCR